MYCTVREEARKSLVDRRVAPSRARGVVKTPRSWCWAISPASRVDRVGLGRAERTPKAVPACNAIPELTP